MSIWFVDTQSLYGRSESNRPMIGLDSHLRMLPRNLRFHWAAWWIRIKSLVWRIPSKCLSENAFFITDGWPRHQSLTFFPYCDIFSPRSHSNQDILRGLSQLFTTFDSGMVVEVVYAVFWLVAFTLKLMKWRFNSLAVNHICTHLHSSPWDLCAEIWKLYVGPACFF